MSQRMLWRNDHMRYGTVSRLLHWLMAVFIIIMLCLGWSMDIIPKEWKPVALGIHKSLGIIILALAIVRLAWRFYNSPAPLPKSMSCCEEIAAVTVHWVLYGLLFVMPLTGWAATSAFGRPIMFLGVVQLPDWVAKDHALGKFLEEMHGYFAYLLAGVITLHIMAALYHNFIKKDNVLYRIWPVFTKKERP